MTPRRFSSRSRNRSGRGSSHILRTGRLRSHPADCMPRIHTNGSRIRSRNCRIRSYSRTRSNCHTRSNSHTRKKCRTRNEMAHRTRSALRQNRIQKVRRSRSRNSPARRSGPEHSIQSRIPSHCDSPRAANPAPGPRNRQKVQETYFHLLLPCIFTGRQAVIV